MVLPQISNEIMGCGLMWQVFNGSLVLVGSCRIEVGESMEQLPLNDRKRLVAIFVRDALDIGFEPSGGIVPEFASALDERDQSVCGGVSPGQKMREVEEFLDGRGDRAVAVDRGVHLGANPRRDHDARYPQPKPPKVEGWLD